MSLYDPVERIRAWGESVDWSGADPYDALNSAFALDQQGFVHFQEHKRWTNRTAYVRWTTAPSFRALASLLAARRERVRTPPGVVGARLD